MRRNIIGAVAIGLILLVAVLLGGQRKRNPQSGETDWAAVSPERPLTRARPAEPPRKPLGRYQLGARTPLPRFVAPAAGPEAPPVTASAPPRLETRGKGELTNKLEKTPPNFQEAQARIKELMKAMHEKADRCVAGWTAPDPALREGVMLALELDKQGLQAVSIKDMVEIPDGPLRCLSNAAYELDWSGLTEVPVMITTPQKYATP